MNYTPEPRNVLLVDAPKVCALCSDVTASHSKCSCTALCGHPRGCYFVEPETFVPPAVPRFRL